MKWSPYTGQIVSSINIINHQWEVVEQGEFMVSHMNIIQLSRSEMREKKVIIRKKNWSIRNDFLSIMSFPFEIFSNNIIIIINNRYIDRMYCLNQIRIRMKFSCLCAVMYGFDQSNLKWYIDHDDDGDVVEKLIELKKKNWLFICHYSQTTDTILKFFSLFYFIRTKISMTRCPLKFVIVDFFFSFVCCQRSI